MTGTIILIPFPFSVLTKVKVRPAVVICSTNDKYEDLILCAISSVVPTKLNSFEIMLKPNKVNNLRVTSIIKIDRIVTLKKEDIIATLGTLTKKEIDLFKVKFKELVD